MKYYITCTNGDNYWHPTDAKTLTGAKRIASQIYYPGGDLMICQVDDNNPDDREIVASKRGFNNWRDAI